MNLNDILADAIAEGAAALAARKLKPKEKKKIQLESLQTMTGQTILPVSRGVFNTTCLVAEYVRRVCSHCQHTELSKLPRVFVCEQLVSDPTTRRLHRVFDQALVKCHIAAGLPVKTEVHSVPSPFCSHCVQEIIHAARPTTERSDPAAVVHPDSSIRADVPPAPGTLPVEAPAEVSPRGTWLIPYGPNPAGLAPSFWRGLFGSAGHQPA